MSKSSHQTLPEMQWRLLRTCQHCFQIQKRHEPLTTTIGPLPNQLSSQRDEHDFQLPASTITSVLQTFKKKVNGFHTPTRPNPVSYQVLSFPNPSPSPHVEKKTRTSWHWRPLVPHLVAWFATPTRNLPSAPARNDLRYVNGILRSSFVFFSRERFRGPGEKCVLYQMMVKPLFLVKLHQL